MHGTRRVVAYILNEEPKARQDADIVDTMAKKTVAHAARKTESDRTKILVFSPDVDLAKSLALLLENQFEIVCETQLDDLKTRIRSAVPALLLIDLFSFPSDILREVNVLRALRLHVPVVLLRVYRQLSPELEETIRDIADLVLYKPFDVNVVAEAVHKLLGVPQQK